MKSILITGGAGFIGSNFVKHIFYAYPDYRILLLDALTYAGNLDNIPDDIKKSSRFEFWYGNVKNPEIVNELASRVDAIVHFAAESHVARSIFDNAIFYETDVLGTQVIANSVVKNKNIQRFVHISTSEVYGTAEMVPMTEDHPLNPMSPYASAKAGADRLVYSYWATYKIPATIVRPFNNYGPNQHLEKVIPRFITSAIKDEPLTVHGTGGSSRDWLYVKDCCAGIDAALHADSEKVEGQVFNLGTSADIDVLAIAQTILERLNKPTSLIKYIGDRPGQVNRHLAGIDKVKAVLDWAPKVDFVEGIEETIKWYTDNESWWDKLKWMKSVPIKTVDGKVEHH